MKAIPDIRAWNEVMVKKYDVETYYEKSNFIIRWIEQMRIRAVLRAVGTRSGERVLEVGCGAGHVLGQIPHGELVGIDLSSHMVRRTKEKTDGKGVRVLQANADQLPFQEKMFDSIICTEVLEHVERPESVMAEIRRVAKPNARIVLSIPNEKVINRVKSAVLRLGLGSIFFDGAYRVPERMNDEWHLHVFDLKELIGQLHPQFSVKKITPIPSPLLPLRYVIACTPC